MSICNVGIDRNIKGGNNVSKGRSGVVDTRLKIRSSTILSSASALQSDFVLTHCTRSCHVALFFILVSR